MKINQISFGQTFLKSSVRQMSAENREKLKSIYAFGQIYPLDIYLGADRKGDLTLEITRSSVYDYLVANDEIPLTPENIAVYNFIKGTEIADKYIHGNKEPVRKATITNMDYISEEVLPYYVADEIDEYFKHCPKKYEN